MHRVGRSVAAVILLVGVFWSGRESSHGLAAFNEHWWCPIPLVLIALGAVIWLVARRPSSAR